MNKEEGIEATRFESTLMSRGFGYPSWEIKQTVVQSAVLLGSLPVGAMLAVGFAGGNPEWIKAGLITSVAELYAAQFVHAKIAQREAQVDREASIAEGFVDYGAIVRGKFFRYTIATMLSANLLGSVMLGGFKVGSLWADAHQSPPAAAPSGMEQK